MEDRKTKNPYAVALGSRGGQKTAERGPEYFSKIAAMRKERKGGRPRKSGLETPKVAKVEPSENWGGKRPGAGRKPSNAPRCPCGLMTVKCALLRHHYCSN